MNDSLFNPPAIVASLGFSGLVKQISQLVAEFDRNERMNLQRALAIGRALNHLRPMCKDGEWGDTLGTMNLSKQRASEFRRGADAPTEVQSPWESIQDMREWLAQNKPPSEEKLSTGRLSGTPDTTLEDESPQVLEAPQELLGKHTPTTTHRKPPKLCHRCQTVAPGHGIPGCKACAALRLSGAKTAEPEPESPPPETFSWPQVLVHLQGIFRNVDLAAEGAKAKGSGEAIKDKFIEARDALSLWLKGLKK